MSNSKTVIASQARNIYKYKNIKRKILNCYENIFYEICFLSVYLHNNYIKLQYFLYIKKSDPFKPSQFA